MPSPTPGPRAGRHPEPLVERESELEALAALRATARAGSGRVAAIEGAPGIGKTRLLREAATGAAEDGMTVLQARCGELEGDFPFAAVRQLFEPVLAASDPLEREELLTGAAEVARPVVDPGARQGADRSAEQGTPILHGLYWLCANLAAHRPLLIVIDDAHWIDAPSARWLTFLARRLEELPVLVLLGIRDPARGTHAALLAEVLANPETPILRPAALQAAGVGAVLANRFGAQPEPEFTDACLEVTGGNPFLVTEVAGQLAGSGVRPLAEARTEVVEARPAGVVRWLTVRLARLPHVASLLVEALAVLGGASGLEIAAAVAGITIEVASKSTDALVGGGILADRDHLEFAHPVLASAAVSRLRPVERAERHARAAAELRARGASPASVAIHLLHVAQGGEGWVVETLMQAAHQALEQGAPETALTYLRRARAEPPPHESRVAVLRMLGEVATGLGAPDAVGSLQEALELSTEPVARAAATLDLAWALTATGRIPEAVAVLERAAEAEDAGVRARLEVELIGAAWMDVRTRPVASRRLRRLTPPARATSPEEGALLANFAQEATMAGGTATAAAQLAERALAGDWLEAPQNTGVFYMAVNVLIFADRFDAAAAALERVMTAARRQSSPLRFAYASSYSSLLSYRTGAVGEAVMHARHALDSDAFTQGGLNRPGATAFLAYGLIEEGDLDGADAALAGTGLLNEPLGGSFFINSLLLARGRLRLAQGEAAAALADLELCGERLAAWRLQNPAMFPWRSGAALARHALGRGAEARALAEEEVALARAWGAPRALGVALQALGRVEEGPAGVAQLRAAVTQLDGSGARLEEARALVDLGARLTTTGARPEAREKLRAGLGLAQACRAAALEGRAYDELIRAGGRPRRVAVSGREALTASERRVAGMAAAGATNRAIAQDLFVTEKTVESHLRNVFRKLGVTSRVDLAVRLGA